MKILHKLKVEIKTFKTLNNIVNLKKFKRYIFLNFIDIAKNLRTTKMNRILKIINPKKGNEKSIHF